MDLSALSKKFEEIRKKTGGDVTPGTIKKVLRRLCKYQTRLSEYVGRGSGNTKDAQKLLDSMVAEIARLIDMASDAGDNLECPNISPGQKRRHHHRHKDRDKDKTGKEEKVERPSKEKDRYRDIKTEYTSHSPGGQAEKQQPSSSAHANLSASTRAALSGPPEIPPEEILFDKDRDYLGGGAFGKVYRAKCRGKDVAVKIPLKQTLTENELRMFRHEVTIMRKIFHPNVVLFLGACTKPGHLMIVAELMQCDLDQIIHTPSKNPPTLYKKLQMARDAALGMNWLHGICQIIHRDLKPANLLLDESMHVKVTDFGFSEILRGDRGLRDMRGPKGTALYMAPEVMRLEEFNETADVYSFGLILYELSSGNEPFAEYTDLDPFFQAVCIDHERPIVPPGTLHSLADLMQRCWHKDPKQRPLFPEIVAELEASIVDSVMSEVPARTFWKKHFLKPLQEYVPWPEFEMILAREIPVAPAQLGRLEHQLGKRPPMSLESSHQVVSMERFNIFYSWFGPFFETGGLSILKEMNQTFTSDWFHGDITKIMVESRLRGRYEGTFLIRLSYSDPGKTPFTVSKVKGGVPTHKRIFRLSYNPKDKARLGVQVGGHDEQAQFQTIVELVLRLHEIGNLGQVCPKEELPNPYLS